MLRCTENLIRWLHRWNTLPHVLGEQRLVKHSSSDHPFAYSASTANELCYASDVDLEAEFMPNVRRVPNHRVSSTESDQVEGETAALLM